MDKAQRYLCLARKAGLLALGEEGCSEAFDKGKAKLLLIAADASPNAQKRASHLLQGRRALSGTLPWTKEELSFLLGAHGCSLVCLTDPAMAATFTSALAETLPEWQETASLMEARAEKAKRRSAAPHKHKSGKGGT